MPASPEHAAEQHVVFRNEFDTTIIFDDTNGSPLIFTREEPPYPRYHKLARVGITRACHHVLMLCDAYTPIVLQQGHRLYARCVSAA